MMEKIFLGFVFLNFLLAGCAQVEVDERYCNTVGDCACGSHVKTGACFYGNRAYVDTSKQCPDFCTGIAGNLRLGCVDNKCVISPAGTPRQGFCGRSTLGACESSDDCVAGGCSGQVCQSENEEPVITTCEYRDCYNADAYKLSCKCVGGKCSWG